MRRNSPLLSALHESNYKSLIEEIEAIGTPILRFPQELALFDNQGPGESWDNYTYWRIKPYYFELLINEPNFKKQIGIITYITEEYLKDGFSCQNYWLFLTFLKLQKLAINEYRESILNIDYVDSESYAEIRNSYIGSENHEVLNGVVFKKTKFWRDAIKSNQEKLQKEEAANLNQALQLSSYGIYVYIMEDTRNGYFKIGKSKNPLKRERTLQSEAPTTRFRFALPCDDLMEYELHQRYESCRIRGEWFELNYSMLFEIVSDLLAKGDAARFIGDKDWLGEVWIRRFSK